VKNRLTLRFTIKNITIKPSDRLTRAEIDLKAVRQNFRQLKRLAGKTGILAVVKADAYGHGAVEVSRALVSAGVDWLGVSDAAEGIVLRQNGIKKPILLFESILPRFIREIVDHRLTPTVCTMEMARALSRYAQKKKRTVGVHVKVDTGMRRLGVWYSGAAGFIEEVHRLPGVTVEGLYTHFPLADRDRRFTLKQLAILEDILCALKKKDIAIRHVHAANSMGLIGFPHPVLTLARPGVMVYGLPPSLALRSKVALKPAMSVKTRVIFLKEILPGEGISYGHTFVASRPMKVATLAIGYHDGYFRALSNKAHVLIGGRKCPVLGTVTMDQTMVDVTHLNSVKPGDEAVVLGAQPPNSVTADDLAYWAGTINYEIVCNLGNLLPRVFKK
jgi:alanine racemase